MKIFYPPEPITENITPLIDVFLLGNTEMGQPWQSDIVGHLGQIRCVGRIFNPRRVFEDGEQQQNAKCKQTEHANWTLDQLNMASAVFVFLDSETQSAIVLAELGYILGKCELQSKSAVDIGLPQDIVVYCPDGFWCQDNVKIMCDMANVPVYREYNSAVIAFCAKLEKLFIYMMFLSNLNEDLH